MLPVSAWDVNETQQSREIKRFEVKSPHSSRDACLPTMVLLLATLLLIGCAGTASSQQPGYVLVTAHSATLSWNPSATEGVGYRVYRSTQSGQSYALLNSEPVSTTSFTDSTVEKGETYFYVVTAVDADFNESGYSNEVFATIPSS
jgi:hypothetical protein